MGSCDICERLSPQNIFGEMNYIKNINLKDEMRKKQNFNGGEIFHYLYNTFIPELKQKHNIKLIL